MIPASDNVYDAIVVGSGASGVFAAWPLAEQGLRVALVDVGFRGRKYQELIPDADFATIRRSDGAQHRYFLGDAFEGIPLGPVRVGAQLTPPRKFITRASEELAPRQEGGFQAMISFALGGLGAGWGASAMPFSDRDMKGWPIGRADLQPHYEAVARRVGICGPERDDLTPELGVLQGMLPPARMDSNAQAVHARYTRKRDTFQRAGLYAGHPRLAVCTQSHRARGPLSYKDMEFWSDPDEAVYRPAYTVRELRRFGGFTYREGLLAEYFEQNDPGTRVALRCRDIVDGGHVTLAGRRLIMAAGTIETARIVLRSLERYHEPVPLVSNPYTYFPCMAVRRLGKPTRDRRHGLTQLTMLFDPDGSGRRWLQPQLYSYRSLLLFKLLKESPLGLRESQRLMRLLSEYFVIVGVFHEDRPGPGKSIRLRPGDTIEHDWMEIDYRPSAEEESQRRADERRLVRQLRRLGLYPIKRIHPGHGASIHYGGTFPMGRTDEALTTTPDGRLRAAPLVALADGSSFPDLPSKGLTLTLMANAYRIGRLAALELCDSTD